MASKDQIADIVSKWAGRIEADAASVLGENEAVITIKLNRGKAPEVSVKHKDSDSSAEAEGERGNPHSPVVPFGETGLQGRQWANNPPHEEGEPADAKVVTGTADSLPDTKADKHVGLTDGGAAEESADA